MLVYVVMSSLFFACLERADLLAVVCVVFCYFPKCVLVKAEVGAVKLA